MFDKLWTLFGRGKTAETDQSGPRACQSLPHSRESGSKARTSGQSRLKERGNVFFTLFGAVAVVGVLGAGIMATMRGPLTTMVEVNRIEETKADLRVSARMVLLKSKDNNCSGEVSATEGDPGTTQYTEAIDPAAAASGMTPKMGTIPGTVGAKRKDAWGTPVGYCAWNNGPDHTSCSALLDGADDPNAIAIALISAGPDRKFDTNCENADTFINQNALGDDIVVQLNYSEAVSSSGGMWIPAEITDESSGINVDAAAISKALSVTSDATSQFSGGATFGNDLRTEGSVKTDVISPVLKDYVEFMGSVLLPQTGPSVTCSGSNVGSIAYDTTNGIVYCNGSGWTAIGGLWTKDTNGMHNDSTAAAHVGIGGDSDASDVLSVTGDVGVTGDTVLTGTLTVGNTTNTFATKLYGALDATGATTLGSTLDVTGITKLADTLEVTGATTLKNTLQVDNTSEFKGDVTVTDKDIYINNAGGTGGNLTAGASITAGTDITATAGDIKATAGDIEATAGSVTAGTTVTAGTGITSTTGDIEASKGDILAKADSGTGGSIIADENVVAGGNVYGSAFYRGTVSSPGPDFSNIKDNCTDSQVLDWDSSGGWSCRDLTTDSLGGSGTGGKLTLGDILANGSDGGNGNNKDAYNLYRVGSDYFCKGDYSDINTDCIDSATLVNGSKIWKNDGPGGTSKIYYNDGNVGVGTNNPGSNLHVVSTTGQAVIQVEGITDSQSVIDLLTEGDGTKLLNSAGTKGWTLYARGSTFTADAQAVNDFGIAYFDGTTWNNAITADSVTRSVGIGDVGYHPKTQLDVAGTLKIGAGTEACDVDHEGAMKYDAGANEFYICRTTANDWEPIGSGSGSGGDVVSYLQAMNPSPMTDVGTIDTKLPLTTIVTSQGSNISLSGGSIVLKAGYSYKLTGAIRIDGNTAPAGSSAAAQFYNTNAGAYIGAFEVVYAASSLQNWSNRNGATAYITPGTDTTIELRVVGASSASVDIRDAVVNIEELGGGMGSGDGSGGSGDAVEFLQAGRATVQNNIASSGPAIVNTIMAHSGSSISLNTTTGVVTLAPGKTYRLSAAARIDVSSAAPAGLNYLWKNVSTDQQIGMLGAIGSWNLTGNWSDLHTAVAYITPTTSTDVQLVYSGTYPVNTNVWPYIWIEALGGGGFSGGADNLGNHTAQQTLDMTDHSIINALDIAYSGTLTDTSDMRLKTDITPLDQQEVMRRLAQVDTYSFHMKARPDGPLEYGVMAQELEKLFPNLVHTANDEMHTKSVNYIGLIAPLIESNKALLAENESLKAEVSGLKSDRDDMRAALQEVRADISALKVFTGYGVDRASIGFGMLGALGGGMAVLFLRRRRKPQEKA
ncbi:MAG: tail fiber domain-containing protein [Alphaproteobacteria bacterium]|nr:tail fiber domain-containing protein [Alphaproteobacteria bacterium]